MREIEQVLLYVSDARARAPKAIATLDRTPSDAAAVLALQRTADDLLAVDRHRRQAS